MHYMIELYLVDKYTPFLRLRECPFQPNEGELINIEKQTYRVVGRSFTVDYAGTRNQEMRMNLIVQPASSLAEGGERADQA